jgi:predicted ATPase
MDEVQRCAVLIVMTFRPEFIPPWADRPHVTMRPLNRLSRGQGAAMIQQIAGSGAMLPREVAEQILDRTDGVPLFVEELTKAVLKTGQRTGGPAFTGSPVIPSTSMRR